MRVRVRCPMTSTQTATSLLPPALATTGKADPVSTLSVAPCTTTLVNVVPPSVERANFTPPVGAAHPPPAGGRVVDDADPVIGADRRRRAGLGDEVARWADAAGLVED